LERWDGQDRWVRYVFRKKAKLQSVQIDPGYQVTLDRDYLNNSRVIKSQRAAIAKIATYWMFLTQFLAQLLSWLA
jgi:hypothetical protein